MKHCRPWKNQQATMWREVRKATDGKRKARNTYMVQLFGDERCTVAILDFLGTTDVGLRGKERRLEVDEEEEERTGEEHDEEDGEGAQNEGWEGLREDEGG
jgi:hypothetical protein